MDTTSSLFAILSLLAFTACGPNLKLVPNPVTDKATLSKEFEVSSIETNPNKNLYWGDLDVHTNLSFDAFFSGTLTTCDEAYRYAKGEEISIYGRPVGNF